MATPVIIKIRRFSFYCFLMSMLFSSVVMGQPEAIRFKHLSHKDGLIQSAVSSMLQDKSGYIWITNWSGLTRYDGNAFKNFRQSDTTNTALSHNRVNRVYEDRNGKLWIATSGGLNLYDEKTETFRHVGMLPGKGGGNFIAALLEDNEGKMWVSTFRGLKYVSNQNDSLVTVQQWKKNEHDLFQGVSFSLFLDTEKTMWVGIRQGIKRFSPKTKEVLPLPTAIAANKELALARIVVIRQDASGDMWFGTEEHGLFRYDKHAQTCYRYVHDENNRSSLPSNWINDILIKDGKLWIATRNGLAILHEDRSTFTNYNHNSADPTSLNDDSVWSLMRDATGNVWIGTYAGGVDIYYPGISNFTSIGERIGNNLGLDMPITNAIVESDDEGLWIGTFGGGVNYINRKKNIAHSFPVRDAANRKFSHEIKTIAKDKRGNLWLGTLDGLCIFDIGDKKVRYVHLEVMSGKTGTKLINALLVDENGIWVGTNGGGLRFVNFDGKETRTFVNESDQVSGLSDNYVNALLKDGDDLWIATQNGLNKLQLSTGKFVVYRRQGSESLTNNNVSTLYKDASNRLWVGTNDGGLNCFDRSTGKVYAITTQQGLADNVVAAILEDNQGNLWVSTHNGISKILLTTQEIPLTHHDYTVVNYTSGNGLPGNQFVNNAKVKTKEGELLFGGMNGVVAFYPERIVSNTNMPKILFTGFAVKNKDLTFGDNSSLQYPVNEASEVTLEYDDNNVTIKFSALNFIHAERNQYAYKMTGLNLNDEWTEIGNQKEVTFVNLKPGRYVFHVRAANNDGVWNVDGRKLTITILPPWWRTVWAYLFYTIVALILTYVAIRFLRIRAKLERDLYHEHLHSERQEEFYRMKLDFFTNISHEIRTPLTLILGPVENLEYKTRGDSYLNKQVLQIRNNAERLLRLIGELMDFRKAESGSMTLNLKNENLIEFVKEVFLSFQSLAESRTIRYAFEADQDMLMIAIDKGQLEKVLFNLLSNAFKFTPEGGTITVAVTHDNNRFAVLTISDNGKGISPEHHDKVFTNFYQVQPDPSKPGTGVGLALSKSIVELHNGTIRVESSPMTNYQAGKTVFTVRLPMHTSHAELIVPKSSMPKQVENIPQTEIELPEGVRELSSEKKYTILLAEDNDELRNFVAEALSAYRVVLCMNGMEAYNQAVEEIPDLIISDIMMPVMNGIELCGKIKTDERTSHIPVILLTALASHSHQVNGLKTGADVYITKPFSIQLLELNIFNLLLSRERMRQKYAQRIVLEPLNIEIASADEVFMKKLVKIVEENMSHADFGVPELGGEIGMSKTVLFKKISALTDLSPVNFIKSLRLKKAAMLLQQSTLSVNEVAMRVGFNDPKYFSKEFKKFHGKLPTEISLSEAE